MTHTIYALCVWAKSTSSLFSRECSAFIVSFFLCESSALVCPFSRENWGNHLPPAARPAVAEAARRLRSWGSQMELADEFERGIKIWRSSAADESKLLEEDVLCLTSSSLKRRKLWCLRLTVCHSHVQNCYSLTMPRYRPFFILWHL